MLTPVTGTVKRVKMKRPKNLIGPQVRKIRDQKDWSQAVLAQKLQLQGWDLNRTSIAKLEAQLRRVTDGELLFLAKVLQVPIADLLPKNPNFKTLGPLFRH